MIYPFDDRRKIALPGHHEETLQFAVNHFIECAQNAIETHGRFFVALSGGSTPKELFRRLSQPMYRDAIDWSQVHIFWSDERCVPPDHPDSNYKMAMENGISTLPIPKNQIYRLIGEEKPEQHAKEYESIIKDKLLGYAFDLIMLGMGEDGHTASLFPKTQGLNENDRLIIVNHIPQKNTNRMTMTYKCINQANNIVFYVMGEKKQEMIDHIFTDPEADNPCTRVGTSHHPALWIIDTAAAHQLLKHWKPKGGLKRVG